MHEIVFHSNGGYDFHTIYNMPIWLRNFTFNKMKEHYENEASAVKKAQSGDSKSTSVIGEDGRVKSPEFLTKSKTTTPNYTTKASKK